MHKLTASPSLGLLVAVLHIYFLEEKRLGLNQIYFTFLSAPVRIAGARIDMSSLVLPPGLDIDVLASQGRVTLRIGPGCKKIMYNKTPIPILVLAP